MSQTIYDKIWNDHLVHQQDDGTALLFVDRHLVHEVTSPQAFEGLRSSNRKVRQPKLTLAVADHNVPTTDRSKGISDEESKLQVETLEKNCKEFGVQLFGMNDKRQGIVHIIGPEQGFTQPGTIIVCGDSHTATHGAFGSLAFGIGTSEVEHVLATQTLIQKKAKNFRINVNGKLPIGVTSKDVILQIIGKIGTAGGTGYVIEYAGSLISSLSVEQRMTVCNMSIEGGARAGLIEPDQKIFDYLKNKPMSPQKKNWNSPKNWNIPLFSLLFSMSLFYFGIFTGLHIPVLETFICPKIKNAYSDIPGLSRISQKNERIYVPKFLWDIPISHIFNTRDCPQMDLGYSWNIPGIFHFMVRSPC